MNQPKIVGASNADEPPKSRGVPDRNGVFPASFARAVPSEGVSRPPSIHEIETHREHLRLNLENWEKQWADELRYERAKVEDKATTATIRRALTRAASTFALALSAFLPAFTDPGPLGLRVFELLTIREALLMIGTGSFFICLASLWWAARTWLLRRATSKSRTQPILPPVRLDAVQLLASLEVEGNPLYYRERDVTAGPDFGWRPGTASPPQPSEEETT